MITLDQAGRGVHDARVTTPSAALAHIIEHGWIERCDSEDRAQRAWRIVPDVSPHIIYQVSHAGSGARYRLVVVGARRIHVDIDRSTRVGTAGLRLRPGALRRLFGLDASELTDRSVPLHELVGPPASELLERLASAPASHAPRLLETFAATRLARPGRGRGLTAGVLRAFDSVGSTQIGRLAEMLGVSGRGLRHLMREHVGLSPKRAARVRRLHAALGSALVRRSPAWSRIAAEAGYADQSHMIREFVALLGEPPETYVRRRTAPTDD